jgi:hypothetical protein
MGVHAAGRIFSRLLGRSMKYSELEDASKLATQEWVESRLERCRIDLRTKELERQSKLLNCIGLIVFGLVWGFAIAMIILSHK